MTMRFSPRFLGRIVPILVVLVLLGLRLWPNLLARPIPATTSADPTTVNAALLAAARAHASNIEIEARGRVTWLLPDDTEVRGISGFWFASPTVSRFSWRTIAILRRVSRYSRGLGGAARRVRVERARRHGSLDAP